MDVPRLTESGAEARGRKHSRGEEVVEMGLSLPQTVATAVHVATSHVIIEENASSPHNALGKAKHPVNAKEHMHMELVGV